MSHPELGRIIEGRQYRDAVHVAIAPVISAERLRAGEHVGFVLQGREVVGRSPKPIGIVDPFLSKPVEANERFWLFLYPQTITALRHEWTHPAFDPAVSASEQWLRDYADGVGLNYQELLDGAKAWIEERDYLNRGSLLEGVSVPDEFWPHYEHVTGKAVPEGKQQNFFTCSC